MREAWTDERLDDLKEGMHREFDQVHTHDRELRAEIRDLRAHMDARFDGMQRTLTIGCVSILASIVGAVLVNSL